MAMLHPVCSIIACCLLTLACVLSGGQPWSNPPSFSNGLRPPPSLLRPGMALPHLRHSQLDPAHSRSQAPVPGSAFTHGRTRSVGQGFSPSLPSATPHAASARSWRPPQHMAQPPRGVPMERGLLGPPPQPSHQGQHPGMPAAAFRQPHVQQHAPATHSQRAPHRPPPRSYPELVMAPMPAELMPPLPPEDDEFDTGTTLPPLPQVQAAPLHKRPVSALSCLR